MGGRRKGEARITTRALFTYTTTVAWGKRIPSCDFKEVFSILHSPCNDSALRSRWSIEIPCHGQKSADLLHPSRAQHLALASPTVSQLRRMTPGRTTMPNNQGATGTHIGILPLRATNSDTLVEGLGHSVEGNSEGTSWLLENGTFYQNQDSCSLAIYPRAYMGSAVVRNNNGSYLHGLWKYHTVPSSRPCCRSSLLSYLGCLSLSWQARSNQAHACHVQ